MILLLVSLILGSLLSKEWVVHRSWSGGILRANTGTHEGIHYSDLSCKEDCIFEDLHKAGVILIIFDLLSLISLLVWLTAVVYKTKGIEILKTWKKIAVVAFAVVFHWVAICAWGGVTRITFGGNKYYSSNGPALGVSAAVLAPIFVGFYLILTYETKIETHIPNMESIRVEGRHKWTEKKSVEDENRN